MFNSSSEQLLNHKTARFSTPNHNQLTDDDESVIDRASYLEAVEL
jgi:hypothetical protein